MRHAPQYVARNVTNAALKATIAAVNATEPLIALRANASAALVQPVVALADRLATESEALVANSADLTPQERAGIAAFNDRNAAEDAAMAAEAAGADPAAAAGP